MADNVTANAGSGGATFATDDDGTAHHPYVKLEFGADNTQTKVSTADPLPVTLANTGANATAVKIDGSAVTQPVSIAAAVAVTDNSSTLSVDDGGSSLTVDGTVAISGTVAVTDNSSTLSVDDGGASLTVDNAALSVTGGGVQASALRVTIASDSTGVLSVDDNGSTLSVDDGAGSLTVDNGGTFVVQPGPSASGGLSIFRSLDLDETEEDVKTSAGQVYAVFITNFATSTRYVKFFNAAAASVTVGSTTPVITLAVPGNASDDTTLVWNGGGMGLAFDTAICVAATTGLADSDTGAPSANDVLINVFYK